MLLRILYTHFFCYRVQASRRYPNPFLNLRSRCADFVIIYVYLVFVVFNAFFRNKQEMSKKLRYKKKFLNQKVLDKHVRLLELIRESRIVQCIVAYSIAKLSVSNTPTRTFIRKILFLITITRWLIISYFFKYSEHIR